MRHLTCRVDARVGSTSDGEFGRGTRTKKGRQRTFKHALHGAKLWLTRPAKKSGAIV